ncbi:hypothetical protein FHS43_003422 [Streptosporangium becharense]|uniref:DUF397 domain-containing protein n=1 Tax=Streptosporangium becharense TaxID=1816182 RepID=A0A7W9IDE8_9ACTN|nr:DUF397 domain-containing protein [Streptosporangium becharense]MBB2912142.1 hypothetical protein [Streptosporangium becharense]MBB5818689.1 hypothetical protein [Streptosporangium becharense]
MDELTQEITSTTWRRSTLSGPDGGNCVEVASLSRGRRGVRDSKDPDGPVLVFGSGEWSAFLTAVKDGAFG